MLVKLQKLNRIRIVFQPIGRTIRNPRVRQRANTELGEQDAISYSRCVRGASFKNGIGVT